MISVSCRCTGSFPAGLRDLGDRYIVPKLVVIRLYHHAYSSDHDHLKKMEKVKRAAGDHLSKRWGDQVSPDQVYRAVLVPQALRRPRPAAGHGG
jgi:hypothetical protein